MPARAGKRILIISEYVMCKEVEERRGEEEQLMGGSRTRKNLSISKQFPEFCETHFKQDSSIYWKLLWLTLYKKQLMCNYYYY